MANFNTHVGVASASSTLAAALAVNINLIEMIDAPWYVFIGAIGGMLPDIDADHSIPLKRFFWFVACLCGLGAYSIFAECLSSQRLALVAALTIFVIRYPVFFMFQTLTIHRGVIHSLLGAVFFGLLLTCIGYNFLHWTIVQSWLSGFFLSFGFIVHLSLDEIFSVDLANGRMKRSFGTALKLFNYHDIPTSTLMLVATVALFIAAPSYSHLCQAWQKTDWKNFNFQEMVKYAGLENYPILAELRSR